MSECSHDKNELADSLKEADSQCGLCGEFLVKRICIWKEEKGIDTDGVYKTDCDNMFTIMEGNPQANFFKYCPYCGKTIKEEEI